MSQNYLWPTDAGKFLSSNFGEFRDTHFHMGLDIKTNEVTGYPVVAVDDGYLSRMATNYNGYGKALYLTTKSGHIAVYAHLEKFSPRFESVLKVNQRKKNSYFVYQYFTQYEFPVTKGEVIGYTGNTGSSSGPHLHFEIRNLDDEPLNPLLHGLELSDHLAPVFKRVAFIPRSMSTRINASPLPQVFEPYRDRKGEYYLPDTLHLTGPFSTAALVYDKREGVNNIYQINSLKLTIDKQTAYSVQFDHIPYEETGYVNTAYDHYLARLNEGRFNELYRYPTDPALSIEDQSETGLISLPPGYHTLEIVATDHAGNISSLNGTLFNHPVSGIILEPIQSDDNTVTFSIEPAIGNFPFTTIIPYSFSPFGAIEEQLSPTIIERNGKKITFSLPTEKLVGKPVQVFGINRLGAYSEPENWIPSHVKKDIFNVSADIDMLDIRQGLYLQVTLSNPIDGALDLNLNKENELISVPLHHIQPQAYITDIQEHAYLNNINGIDIVITDAEDQNLQQVLHFAWKPQLAKPGETTTILSQDNRCSMRIPGESLYDITSVWIEKVEQSVTPATGLKLSDVYQLQPFTLALRDTVQVGIMYNDEYVFEDFLGVYTFDQKKQKWLYHTSVNHPRRRIVTAAVNYLDAVTIIQDNNPPFIVSSFPAEGGYYHYQDVEVLRVKVDDALSGIKSKEEAIYLAVDDEKVYAEYQPVEKEVSYRLTTPLYPGQHSLSVSVQDNVGHTVQKKILFRIN